MPDSFDDSSLVAGCIKRNAFAWNRFVEHYSGLIFWAIKEKLNSSGCLYKQQDLEDIFQDVFVLLWQGKKLKQIKNRRNISMWLSMLAANCAHNYFRNIKEELSSDGILQETTSSDCQISSTLDQESSDQIMERVLNSLSPRELIILKLNYFHNKTHQEIAQILGVPTNTISSIIKRTKEKVKEELNREGLETF